MIRNYEEIELWKNVPLNYWQDWQWQLANRIRTVEELEKIITITAEEYDGIKKCLEFLRMAITPHYALLMAQNDSDCPIRKQAVPTISETYISKHDCCDPLHESADSPVPGLTHRYPDRVLMLVTDQCSMYCRHCTRRRFAGNQDSGFSIKNVNQSVEYIKQNKEIRDVLISGGDPLCLSEEHLEYVIEKLSNIKHVEIIRIGTRVPVVMPQRITPKLCSLLKKYHPIWINTHFNHPKEMTDDSVKACDMLSNSGIPLGNQSVLLKGINDCPYIMKNLVQKLVKNRIRPYYIYQCDLSEGIEHFRTSVSVGIEIIEMLRGHTSGLAVPTYVIDAPGGGGKIPVAPQYLISQSNDKIILRNFEGVTCTYDEPKDKAVACKECGICKHKGKRSVHHGLEKLFQEDNRSLIPDGNDRISRRDKIAKTK